MFTTTASIAKQIMHYLQVEESIYINYMIPINFHSHQLYMTTFEPMGNSQGPGNLGNFSIPISKKLPFGNSTIANCPNKNKDQM